MSKEKSLDNEEKENDFIGDVLGITSKCFLIDDKNKDKDITDDLWRCLKCKREIHIMNRLGKDDLCE